MKVRCINAKVGSVGRDVRKVLVQSLLKEGQEYQGEVLPNGHQIRILGPGGDSALRVYRLDRFVEA